MKKKKPGTRAVYIYFEMELLGFQVNILSKRNVAKNHRNDSDNVKSRTCQNMRKEGNMPRGLSIYINIMTQLYIYIHSFKLLKRHLINTKERDIEVQDANWSHAIETGEKVMIGEKYFPIEKLKEYSENPNTFSVCVLAHADTGLCVRV